MSGSGIQQPEPNHLGNEDILMPSAVKSSDLSRIRHKYQVAPEIGLLLPPHLATADTLVEGYCCMYEVCWNRVDFGSLFIHFFSTLLRPWG